MKPIYKVTSVLSIVVISCIATLAISIKARVAFYDLIKIIEFHSLESIVFESILNYPQEAGGAVIDKYLESKCQDKRCLSALQTLNDEDLAKLQVESICSDDQGMIFEILKIKRNNLRIWSLIAKKIEALSEDQLKNVLLLISLICKKEPGIAYLMHTEQECCCLSDIRRSIQNRTRATKTDGLGYLLRHTEMSLTRIIELDAKDTNEFKLQQTSWKLLKEIFGDEIHTFLTTEPEKKSDLFRELLQFNRWITEDERYSFYFTENSLAGLKLLASWRSYHKGRAEAKEDNLEFQNVQICNSFSRFVDLVKEEEIEVVAAKLRISTWSESELRRLLTYLNEDNNISCSNKFKLLAGFFYHTDVDGWYEEDVFLRGYNSNQVLPLRRFVYKNIKTASKDFVNSLVRVCLCQSKNSEGIDKQKIMSWYPHIKIESFSEIDTIYGESQVKTRSRMKKEIVDWCREILKVNDLKYGCQLWLAMGSYIPIDLFCKKEQLIEKVKSSFRSGAFEENLLYLKTLISIDWLSAWELFESERPNFLSKKEVNRRETAIDELYRQVPPDHEHLSCIVTFIAANPSYLDFLTVVPYSPTLEEIVRSSKIQEPFKKTAINYVGISIEETPYDTREFWEQISVNDDQTFFTQTEDVNVIIEQLKSASLENYRKVTALERLAASNLKENPCWEVNLELLSSDDFGVSITAGAFMTTIDKDAKVVVSELLRVVKNNNKDFLIRAGAICLLRRLYFADGIVKVIEDLKTDLPGLFSGVVDRTLEVIKFRRWTHQFDFFQKRRKLVHKLYDNN